MNVHQKAMEQWNQTKALERYREAHGSENTKGEFIELLWLYARGRNEKLKLHALTILWNYYDAPTQP